MLYLLDYGAGSRSHAAHTDIQSLANSLERLGHHFQWVRDPSDIDKADVCAAHKH